MDLQPAASGAPCLLLWQEIGMDARRKSARRTAR